MYLIEGEENGFTSIPESIYWTIVTLTTVGYGDIVPGTTIGRLIAAIIMIMGYGIIAVPTGIVSAEMAQKRRRPDTKHNHVQIVLNHLTKTMINSAIAAEKFLMKNKLVYIGGPTCSGKTNLSILLANTLGTEIISCDSRQFYRELSIGTAKPSKSDLKTVKHHFIDHLSIHDEFSVGTYSRETNEILKSLFNKINIVIMVGGSGLYADSILYGIDRFPKVKTDIKKQIISLFKNEGIKRLNSMLEKYDPEYYNIVDKNNSRRIIRALEICLSTGKPFTSFLKKREKIVFLNQKYC